MDEAKIQEEDTLYEISICISPCITAKTKGLTEYALRYHLHSLIRKVGVLCKVFDGVRSPRDYHELSGQDQFCLKFITLAPVLTMIALNDMKKLVCCTAINTVQVPQFTAKWRPTTVTTSEAINYGVLVTWAI
ncbi:hypothetical protein Z517_03129 [Fonsecaea pedrosoi CBS 271.37]|uniref:Uncharacterized protein n=1 Tax=Fonsecaea pedrosoi CBS 271.37 TaxID=1442368 RepID=A0A0D2GSD4_9EURO|nr:uncharacterized protein Z517_03129 [Fonsecaea pedrosoi CBS 271.37]KIW83883.1 hypothetical protein Z517_03129 [Fonsecaea pedrosoi CBS 271.37]